MRRETLPPKNTSPHFPLDARKRMPGENGKWGGPQGGRFGGLNRTMKVYLEMGEENMRRNGMLLGGTVAGVIAILCALALANTLNRSEKGK
jgi:hypothetical protein